MFNLEASLIVLVVTQNIGGSEEKGWLLAVAACYQATVKMFRYKHKLLCHKNEHYIRQDVWGEPGRSSG